MPNVVIWNQTPRHVRLHHPNGPFLLAPLQRRRLGRDPRLLFGEAALAARHDQVVAWEAEPTRSAVVQTSALAASLALLSALVAASAFVWRRPVAGSVAAAVAALGLVGAALGMSRARPPASRDPESRGDEPAQPHATLTGLLKDLVLSVLQYSALVGLVLVGVSAPAAAIYFGTDLSDVLDVTSTGLVVNGGAESDRVLVVRGLQLVLVITVSLVPALMYYQFDRERLSTLVDRWLHVIFRLDPTVRTVAEVDAKYGRRVEELLGAGLHVDLDPTPGRRRDRSPVVVCTLLLAVGWVVVVLSVPSTDAAGKPVSVQEMFHPLLTPMTMAFLGAYFLSVQVALRGFLRGDLKPKTYNIITVRVLMSVVLAWALQTLAGDGTVVLATAFVGGILPSTALLVVRSAAGGRATSDEELDRRSPLTQIDEIDVYERTRLEEEGITSIQALARYDLVDLMLSTRIPAPRLIDWVDQALLLQHLTADGTQRLRALGVRSATDLLQVLADPDAEAELARSVGDACSPALLRTVLRNEEWLACLQHWRSGKDPALLPPLEYGGPVTEVDLRAPYLQSTTPVSTPRTGSASSTVGRSSPPHSRR